MYLEGLSFRTPQTSWRRRCRYRSPYKLGIALPQQCSWQDFLCVSRFLPCPASCSHIPCSTFQILFYALRPGFVRTQTLTKWHLINFLVQLIFNYIMVQTFGFRPLLYLLFSSFFAGSLHPCAGHFIAEHYVWDGLNQETYSYYGPLNILAYNVSRTIYVMIQLTMSSRWATTTNTTTFLLYPGHVYLPSVLSRQSSMTAYPLIPAGQWSSLTLFGIRRLDCSHVRNGWKGANDWLARRQAQIRHLVTRHTPVLGFGANVVRRTY